MIRNNLKITENDKRAFINNLKIEESSKLMASSFICFICKKFAYNPIACSECVNGVFCLFCYS